MMNNHNLLIVVAATMAASWITYSVVDSGWRSEVARMKEEYARAAYEESERHNRQLQARERAMSEAIAEKDRQLADVSGIRERLESDLDRMRKLAADRSAVSPVATDPGQPCEADRTECESLLIEGADLLREGARLLGEQAAGHDALIKLLKAD